MVVVFCNDFHLFKEKMSGLTRSFFVYRQSCLHLAASTAFWVGWGWGSGQGKKIDRILWLLKRNPSLRVSQRVLPG